MVIEDHREYARQCQLEKQGRQSGQSYTQVKLRPVEFGSPWGYGDGGQFSVSAGGA